MAEKYLDKAGVEILRSKTKAKIVEEVNKNPVGTHTHEIADVSGLQSALDGKQAKLTFDNTPTASSSNPVKSSGIKAALDAKANSTHTHAISNISNLQSSLNAKANSSDVYTKEQANLLINNKADKSHRHVASDITDLQDKLDDKLNIANSTYIFGDTASETKFNLMELGTMPARTRIIQFVGDPNVDPVISVGFGNGNGLNVHYDSLKHKVNNTEYDVLDTSMELSYQDTLDYLNSL